MAFNLDINRIMMFIVRTAAVIMFVVVIGIFMTSFQVIVKDKDLDRTSVEISEGLMSSPLAAARAVFTESKLDELDGMLTEPYARACGVAYNVVIRDITEEKEWSFGMELPTPSKPWTYISDPVTRDYPVGIFVPGARQGNFYNSVRPAVMTLHVFESWVTRVTCLAEKALETRQVEEMLVTCGGGHGCAVFVRRSESDPDLLCTVLADGRDWQCRYAPDIPVRFTPPSHRHPENPHLLPSGSFILRAVPVAAGALVDCAATALLEERVAKEVPAEVVFCLEELPSGE